MKTGKTKVGLIGLGLDTYWSQFEGLYTRLCGYQDWIASEMSRPDTEVVNAGIADNPVKAVEAAEDLEERRDQPSVCLYLYLCFIFDGPAVGPACEGPGYSLEYPACCGNRL